MEHVAPEIALWLAVLTQLVEDALDFQRLGPDRHGYREEAHHEMQRPGRMLQRLTGLAGVDQTLVIDSYRRRLKGMRPEMSGASNPETARLSPQP